MEENKNQVKTAGQHLDNFLAKSEVFAKKANAGLKDAGIDTEKLGRSAAKGAVKLGGFLSKVANKASQAIQEAAKDEQVIQEDKREQEE